MYSHIVLETRSRYWQGHDLFEASRDFVYSQLLVATSNPLLVAAELQSPPSFSMASILLSMSSHLLLKTPVIGFRTHAKSRIISFLGPKLHTTVMTLCSHSEISGE